MRKYELFEWAPQFSPKDDNANWNALSCTLPCNYYIITLFPQCSSLSWDALGKLFCSLPLRAFLTACRENKGAVWDISREGFAMTVCKVVNLSCKMRVWRKTTDFGGFYLFSGCLYLPASYPAARGGGSSGMSCYLFFLIQANNEKTLPLQITKKYTSGYAPLCFY